MQRDAAEMAEGRMQVIGFTEVIDVESRNGHVTGGTAGNPDLPRIQCEHVVLATNIWGPVLGDKLGVPLPLLAYEHQYVVTGPVGCAQAIRPKQPRR